MFVPFGETQTWQPYRNNEKDLPLSFAIETLELRLVEIYASSSAGTVKLAKTQVITHLLTYATVFSAAT